MADNTRGRRSDAGSDRPSSHFFKIIHTSEVPYQKLRIPKKFIIRYGKDMGNHIFLKVPSGAVWNVELVKSSDAVWMCNGWKEFAKYYSIGFRHLLVFRYDGSSNFHVIILDTSASEIEYPASATHTEQTNIKVALPPKDSPVNKASNSRRWRSDVDRSNRSSSQVKAAPHFFKIIHSADVPNQKLRIPKNFIIRYGKNMGNHVFLKVPSGAVWKVELDTSNDVVWMCNGWKEFAKYYSLGFGHLLVFRYDGSYNFHVLIFDTSASEIEYPVTANHGEPTNINVNGNSKILKTEDIESDDSVEIFGGSSCATYNTIKEEICRRDENEKDTSVEILDDSLVPDFPVFDRERANKKSRMENNSNRPELPTDIQSKGLMLPNQTKNVMIETETEDYPRGTPIEKRQHRSQIPVKMLSATANVNSTALERAQTFKSKKPFFVVQMQPSYVTRVCYMNVPLGFVKKYLRDNQKNINLQISDGTTWLVRCYAQSTVSGKRSLGWGPFVRANNLIVGDVCVFELMSNGIEPTMNVTIFRK